MLMVEKSTQLKTQNLKSCSQLLVSAKMYSAILSTFQTTSVLPVAISMQIFPESLLSGKADVKVVIESVK